MQERCTHALLAAGSNRKEMTSTVIVGDPSPFAPIDRLLASTALKVPDGH
jgi:hypothetical protein